ncbi:MAG: hypothetical protein DMG06_06280 [Acidobacteria bacterium]|nr:MAG: hypothetical protein DMG06_06280 [Acidobacteriota bacterium]
MWRTLWLLWTAVILCVTTMPWSNFKGHSHWANIGWIPFYDPPLTLFDILANLLLFVPFGFCYVRFRQSRQRAATWLRPVLLAGLLSASVEFFQVFCHNRISSTTDLCSNIIGAAIGTALALKGRKPS